MLQKLTTQETRSPATQITATRKCRQAFPGEIAACLLRIDRRRLHHLHFESLRFDCARLSMRTSTVSCLQTPIGQRFPSKSTQRLESTDALLLGSIDRPEVPRQLGYRQHQAEQRDREFSLCAPQRRQRAALTILRAADVSTARLGQIVVASDIRDCSLTRLNSTSVAAKKTRPETDAAGAQ